MRPPFLRLSSVSSVAYTRVRSTSPFTNASISSAEEPAAAALAASITMVPSPAVRVRLSMTRTGTVSATARAALRADSMVADSSRTG